MNVRFQLINSHAILSHLIAMANGDLLVFKAFEVDRHAERCSHFVLAAVALTDASCFIVINVPFCRELVADFIASSCSGCFFESGRMATS